MVEQLVPTDKEVVKPNAAAVRTGDRFGQWTILDVPLNLRAHKHTVLCQCACGRIRRLYIYNLLRGCSTQCHSCAQKHVATQHGGSRTRLYDIWLTMRKRCSATANKMAYDLYYGRGIRVCDEWENSFQAFKDWALANGYRDDLSIDRWPDKNGNYQPTNCRWATWEQQQRNRRDNLILTAFGESKTPPDWEEDSRCHVSARTLRRRIRDGWPVPAAITEPRYRISRTKSRTP